MKDFTGDFASLDTYARRDKARKMMDSDASICHIVVGHGDLSNSSFDANPVFLVFDDEGEWDNWVSLHQLNGSIDAVHR